MHDSSLPSSLRVDSQAFRHKRRLKSTTGLSRQYNVPGLRVTDGLAVEFQASVIKASLVTSPDDPTGVPDKIEESSVGDTGQLSQRCPS